MERNILYFEIIFRNRQSANSSTCVFVDVIVFTIDVEIVVLVFLVWCAMFSRHERYLFFLH